MKLYSVMLFLALIHACSYSTLLFGQMLEIKLINGITGHVIANACVNVWVGDGEKDPLAIPTDGNGVARLRLTENDAEVNTDHSWKNCGDFGVIGPAVKYKDVVQVNVGYVVCEPHGADFSWLEVKRFPTKQFVHEGFVTANTCGRPIASARPGELVIFVRPLNWWEKLKE